MRNKILIAFLIPFMMFFLTGCPYSSEVPLDQPTTKIDQNLLGKWVKKSEDEHPKFYLVTKLNETTLQFAENEYSSSDKKYNSKEYKGHLTIIGNTKFLNLERDAKYYFHKIEMSSTNQSFTLFEVTDNIDETFSTSAEMKAFFTKYKDLSFFYNKDEVTYNKSK